MSFNTRRERILQHGKNREILFEKRIPLSNEGVQGDIRLSSTTEGLRILVKKGTEWFGTPPLDVMTNKANTNEQTQAYISKIKDSNNDEAINIGSLITIHKPLTITGALDGATPVLKLEQLDVDDTFINFQGTTASDDSKSISTDTTTDSAKYGAIKIEINGTTKWIRIYDTHS